MNILIVEDEPLVAMALEELAVEEGHNVTGIAATRDGALCLAFHVKPQIAFVDVRLADGPTGPDIGFQLARQQIGVVFLTGSADLVPEDMAGAVGVVDKPYRESDMQLVLAFLASAIGDGASPPPPLALLLAPGRMPDRDGQYRMLV